MHPQVASLTKHHETTYLATGFFCKGSTPKTPKDPNFHEVIHIIWLVVSTILKNMKVNGKDY